MMNLNEAIRIVSKQPQKSETIWVARELDSDFLMVIGFTPRIGVGIDESVNNIVVHARFSIKFYFEYKSRNSCVYTCKCIKRKHEKR